MEDEVEEHERLARRDALKVAVTAIGGFISAALGIPAIAYILGPALKADEAEWVLAGPLSKIELGVPTLFKSQVIRQSGWVEEKQELGVYIVTDDGREFHAMSNICTHLGCRVRWIAERQQFFSPCHNGVFDRHGFVISGPPPRPLDEFTTKIEDGNLFIKLPAIRRTA